MSDPVYQKVVTSAAIWFVAGLVYFGLIGRHRPVYCPEEAFAVEASRREP